MSAMGSDGRDLTPIPEDEREEMEILQRLGESSYDELRAAYHDMAARLAPPGREDSDALRVRRRVGKGLLRAACVKNRPIDECEALLEQVTRQGFDDLYDRSTELFPFCRYCVDAGRPDVARRILPDLIREIERFQRATDSPWCANILPPLRALLDEMAGE